METRGNQSRLFLLMLVGMMAFTIAGIVNGLVLVYTEPPLGFILEGAIWGLILGSFLRSRFNLVKVVLAAIVANVVATFVSVMIGFALPIPRFVTYMIMGLLLGLIFGGILGGRKGAFTLGLVGAIGFLLGGILFDLASSFQSPFYEFVEDVWGTNGWIVVAPALIGLFKGLSIGLGLGLYFQKIKK